MSNEITATVEVDELENEIEVSADEIKVVFTSDHSRATNRDLPNQHPMKAIIGLEEKLGQIDANIVEAGKGKITQIKTINGESLIGEGNIIVEGGGTSNESTSYKAKAGLRVAIIGDSISTHPKKNLPEITITSADVGVSLSSYISNYDVGKTISLDGVTSGYTITTDDIGTELSFIPCSSDVGKKLGTPLNYNSITDVWWQVASEELGFEPIPATWSGSSITSHTASSNEKATSYAWHDSIIRRLGTRKSGSMERVAPDVVLIYRGTNDLSHSSKVRLTAGYFDTVKWEYPTTDLLSDGATYGYKEGLALTIGKIRTAYPKAIIVLCTCNVFKRSDADNFPTNNGNFNIPQMNTAIREVAEFFGCHVIDLDKCGITFENCYDSGYITDSATTPTHPNSKGHAMMAKQAISDLIHKVHIYDIEPIQPSISDNEEETTTPTSYVVDPWACWGDGTESATSGYFSFVDYPIEGGATYLIPYGRNYFFEDSSHTYISGGAGGGSATLQVTTPSNASYITICFKPTEIAPEDVTITKVTSTDSGSTGSSTDGEETESGNVFTSTLTSGSTANVEGLYNLEGGISLVDEGVIESNQTVNVLTAIVYKTDDEGGESYDIIDGLDTQELRSLYVNLTVESPSTSYTVKITYEINEQRVIGDLYGTLAEGYYLATTSTGTLTGGGTSTTYYAYKDIEVEGGTTYNTPYARNTAFYDASGNFISGMSPGGTASGTLTTPTNATTMAVTYKYEDLDPSDVTITK